MKPLGSTGAHTHSVLLALGLDPATVGRFRLSLVWLRVLFQPSRLRRLKSIILTISGYKSIMASWITLRPTRLSWILAERIWG